ncbi:unnamed protein product [Rotaria sordida]|uniref:ADP-ribosylglycohydrolase n=1 Tax=Rotaria sordida TaxID=392033 RepID=A0A818U5L0_9BILA|nr:unnamed protein product [Rotaria sordida]CAF3787187.1 unnamed protein product [Rotaria sordida]
MSILLQPNKIIDRALGMAFGTAVGDAMGIPFENLIPEQIAEIQMSLNKNESLFINAAGRNPYIPKEWPTGRWGDATQLSLAIMHAIAKHLCDDAEKTPLITSIVDEHVLEWWDCTDGWGTGTKNAIERIAQGSYSYCNSGGPSTGNDVSHGGTFFCVDTLSMVIGLVAAERVTFETLEKAIQMGGDTNIIAAMIGALLGATQGQQAIDKRRAEIVFRSDYIRQIGEEFGQALVHHLNLLPSCSQTM